MAKKKETTETDAAKLSVHDEADKQMAEAAIRLKVNPGILSRDSATRRKVVIEALKGIDASVTEDSDKAYWKKVKQDIAVR
jgi:hypothetical protein